MLATVLGFGATLSEIVSSEVLTSDTIRALILSTTESSGKLEVSATGAFVDTLRSPVTTAVPKSRAAAAAPKTPALGSLLRGGCGSDRRTANGGCVNDSAMIS
jgi:hypothetical protein